MAVRLCLYPNTLLTDDKAQCFNYIPILRGLQPTCIYLKKCKAVANWYEISSDVTRYNVSRILLLSTINDEAQQSHEVYVASCSFASLVPVYDTTWHHISEDAIQFTAASTTNHTIHNASLTPDFCNSAPKCRISKPGRKQNALSSSISQTYG
jgi:hypothetical protein